MPRCPSRPGGPPHLVAWRAWALAALAVLALQGCSAVKLAYNQLPQLAAWQINRHLGLSDVQAERVRDALDELHQWHRGAMLPRHAQLLQKVQGQLAAPVTAGQACAIYTEVRSQLDEVLAQAEPQLLWLAAQLSEAQIRQLERRQAESNADWRREWLEPSPDKLREHRFKELLSRAEGFYGRLDEPQQSALGAYLAQSSFDPARTYAERERRQKDLVQVLRAIAQDRQDTVKARTLWRDFLARWAQSPDPAYRSYAQKLVAEGCAGFALVHNAMTPAQRQKAVDTARAYELDFVALASR